MFYTICAILEQVTTGTRLGAGGGELSADPSSSFLFIDDLSMGGLPGVKK